MNLFNDDHFPVAPAGTKFDFFCRLPEEDLFAITIRKHDIKVEPTTVHSGTHLTELADIEKQKLFDIIMKVDDIRLLGDKVCLLVSLEGSKPMLHRMEIDDLEVNNDVRATLCANCDLEDSLVCKDKTLMDFLQNTRLKHQYYTAMPVDEDSFYDFSLLDVAQYSKALQDKATAAKQEAERIKVVYSSPDTPKEEVRKNEERADHKREMKEFSEKLEQMSRMFDEIFDDKTVIRNMSDLYRLFSRF